MLPNLTAAAGGSRPVPVTADPREYEHRSIYLFSKPQSAASFPRSVRPAGQQPELSETRASTTAPQALALLNAADATVAAKVLAERLMNKAKTRRRASERAYRLTLGRSPTQRERERATSILEPVDLERVVSGTVRSKNLSTWIQATEQLVSRADDPIIGG